MAGLYKPMHRYESQCSFCGKRTDVMAYDPGDAADRFSQKGWRSIKIASQERERTVPACRRCARRIDQMKGEEISSGSVASQEGQQ